MKKVSYEYGCRALGYTDGEFFVDEDIPDCEIEKMIEEMAGFSFNFQTDNGYEERTEVVYRKI